MSTTKKTTTKKTLKPAKREDVKKSVERINKLRDSIYKKYKDRWTNSYGKDCFNNAIGLLNKAARELNNMY